MSKQQHVCQVLSSFCCHSMKQPCNQARLSADGDFRNYFLVLFSSIVKDYSRVGCRRRPQQSSITTVVQSYKWGVSYAPAPSDIVWSVPTLLDHTFFYFFFGHLSKHHGPSPLISLYYSESQYHTVLLHLN